MKKLIVLILPFCLYAQDGPIGSWKDYLSYSSASFIAETEDNIYCVANGGLYYIKKTDESINRISKITGLSDVSIKQIAHSFDLNTIIITYENCNIDILINNEVVNISDVKRKEYAGIKSINNITINGSVAYLSSTLGLILVDIENYEIIDMYNVTDQNTSAVINGCAFSQDSLIVATDQGLYYAVINGSNLSDFNSWQQYPSAYQSYENIIIKNNTLYVDTSKNVVSISFNNETLIETYSDSIIINNSEHITHSKLEKIKYAWIDNEDNIWAADSINGLLKFVEKEYEGTYTPNCSRENRLFSLDFTNNKLYVCHGGHINFGTFWNKNGASVMDQYENWRNYDYYELKNARDIVRSASYANKTYFASYYNGVVELEDDDVVERYSWWNTNNALDTISYWQYDNKMAISDLKFDKNGNMWGLLSSVERPLFVKTNDNEWFNFSISSNQTFLFDELLIDDYNQKWGIMGRGNGMFVYNDNNTISNIEDDQYILLDMNTNNGSLPSMYIYCIANDHDGEIWFGTDKGIGVFYDPSAVFSGYNFGAEQILITEGDYGQYLLSEETILCITIDGANRKWVGTENSGAFLLSENGQDEILHFTENNSSLFSDKIIDITINHENGEVFFGTEKGIISYRSNSTKGADSQKETKVFPNPVQKNYRGPIAISGLISNAEIKITDVAGNLVFETKANGGTATWDGKNKSGNRASTGVYLVFSTGVDGEEKAISKILFFH